MGYSIRAFIAKRGTFDHFKSLDNHICVAQLEQDFDLLLNDDYLWRGLGLGFGTPLIPDPEGFEHWLLNDTVMEKAGELSQKTPVAYVIADFFGGIGDQQALVWKDGKVVFKRETAGIGAINTALKLIGVNKKSLDEFSSIGLDRHRGNEDWFEECTGISFMEYLNES